MVFNSRLSVPIAAAAAGFGLAWLVKPVPETPAPPISLGQSQGQPAPSRPTGPRDPSRTHSSRLATPPATEPADPAATARIEHAYKDTKLVEQRELSKLVRLSEAIGLSEEQVDRFKTLIAAQREKQPIPGYSQGVSAKDTLDQAIAAAKDFDAKFQSLLTPEQVLALSGYRSRQQENRTEAQAQRALIDVLERIDVTEDQRGPILEALRDTAATEESKLPEGLALLMDSNPTSIGGGTFTAQSLEALTALSQDPEAAKDPLAVSRIMKQHQSEQLAQRTQALTGLLTPAQLVQYRAAIAAQIQFDAPRR